MSVITVAQAREGLVKAIAERGEDFVYAKIDTDEDGNYGSCKYVQQDEAGNDCPSCIVGAAINYIDPALFAILAEEEADGGMSAMNIQTLDFEPDALWALQAAQKAQDNGSTWGRSLEQFDRYIAGELTKLDVEP